MSSVHEYDTAAQVLSFNRWRARWQQQVLSDHALTPADKVAALSILAFVYRKTRATFAGDETLAEHAGLGESGLRHARKALAGAGHLSCTRPKRNGPLMLCPILREATEVNLTPATVLNLTGVAGDKSPHSDSHSDSHSVQIQHCESEVSLESQAIPATGESPISIDSRSKITSGPIETQAEQKVPVPEIELPLSDPKWKPPIRWRGAAVARGLPAQQIDHEGYRFRKYHLEAGRKFAGIKAWDTWLEVAMRGRSKATTTASTPAAPTLLDKYGAAIIPGWFNIRLFSPQHEAWQRASAAGQRGFAPDTSKGLAGRSRTEWPSGYEPAAAPEPVTTEASRAAVAEIMQLALAHQAPAGRCLVEQI